MSHWAWGVDVQLPESPDTDLSSRCRAVSNGVGTGTYNGWLRDMGFYDYSGSGVVHLLGGTVSAVACAFIGPRKGRFRKDGSPVEIPGHSVPLTFIGGFILIFGFLAFNAGAEVIHSY